MRESFATRDEALAACGPDDVAAAVPMNPELSEYRWYVVPKDADDDYMREAAHEVRYGEPMDPMTKWLIAEAKKLRASNR